ncbi:anti-sigma factor [Longimicrobium sp.]|uniref:anti-sigma factor n=1 Tax=Longimicrobium sp. TaxID=2029185 RepID=UPI003B3B215C
MTTEPMHEEFYDALAAEAVDALHGEERERLLAHLAGCASCGAELQSLRAAAALMAFSAPVRPMEPARSDRVRARLLARAAQDRQSVTQVAPAPSVHTAGADQDVTLVGAPPVPVPPAVVPAPPVMPVRREPDVIPITTAPTRQRAPILPWLAAAASLVLLVGVGWYAASLRGRLATAEERYLVAARERGELERRVAQREATLAAVTAPASRVIELAAARPAAPGGRMFWDVATHRWTFFAHNLPAVREGREYQLWLVTTDDRRIPAGTFRPDQGGNAVVQATYALPSDALAAVAVTEEPAGGLPQPSGAIIVAGAAAEAEE